MALDEQLKAALVCPQCHATLESLSDPDALGCPACRLRFPIEDGIPVMLLAEAQPYPA